jgi:hypothetical protein
MTEGRHSPSSFIRVNGWLTACTVPLVPQKMLMKY